MTNPMFNPQPNYSGVTIQIFNPAVNVGQNRNAEGFCMYNPYATNPQAQAFNAVPYADYLQVPNLNSQNSNYNNLSENGAQNNQTQKQLPVYPPQYYLNNYNVQANGNNENIDKIAKDLEKLNNSIPKDNSSQGVSVNKDGVAEDKNLVDKLNSLPVEENVKENDYIQKEYPIKAPQEEDMTKSQNIISDLDARNAAINAEKENSKEQRVVALTDEYIKSLENYLNNPNDEIRLMASKEILTRLDEDKSRYDDAALNALLNKMMQDPSKVIRIASLSAFNSGLASGNDYTIKLLQTIQTNPSADKEDVLQAADILLKMSAGSEIKNIPNPAVKEDNSKEQK